MKGTDKGRKKKPCNEGEERLGYCLGCGVAGEAVSAREYFGKLLRNEEEDHCLLSCAERYCPFHSSSPFFDTKI